MCSFVTTVYRIFHAFWGPLYYFESVHMVSSFGSKHCLLPFPFGLMMLTSSCENVSSIKIALIVSQRLRFFFFQYIPITHFTTVDSLGLHFMAEAAQSNKEKQLISLTKVGHQMTYISQNNELSKFSYNYKCMLK